MTQAESDGIAQQAKIFLAKMTEYSERAQLDPFLNCYQNSPMFQHFGMDGKMRDYEGLKKACVEYYSALKEQKVMTIGEKINLIDKGLVVAGWTGNIVAHFKNGDIMKMNNYAITSVLKKIDDQWKVIHAHESSLPPEIIKK